ncbi:MAG: hypothetical protein DKM50_13060 [Candidatus Margulisiibacteriota bacterium]|nr:MAG: hypothetical protein DKM50_13060 [Candidatus Margulisiibacteriota bacterium]HCY37485.1 hypothetical protein [Candidatus Margulisiibacteriota bacterium]
MRKMINRSFFYILFLSFFVAWSSCGYAAVSTVNFSEAGLIVSKGGTSAVHVQVIDTDGSGIAGISVTANILIGSGNFQSETVTTDIHGTANFLFLAPAFVTTTVIEAYCAGITSNIPCTISIVVAVPLINYLDTPTNNTDQVISGTKTVDISTVNITCNSAVAITAVEYPTNTSWIVTINGLILGDNVISVNAVDVSGNSSSYITRNIEILNSICKIFETSREYVTLQQALNAAATGNHIYIYPGVHAGEGNRGLIWPDIQDISLMGSPNAGTSVNVILNAQGITRNILQQHAIRWVLDNLTLMNGQVSVINSGDNAGGAIYIGVNSSSQLLTINASVLSGNAAYLGGAVYGGGNASRINLIGSIVKNNTADYGGAFNSGVNVFKNSLFQNNLAVSGGGFYEGNNELINCLVISNNATLSGGAFFAGDNKLINCTLAKNTPEVYYDNSAAAGIGGELEAYNTIFADGFDGGTGSYFNTCTISYSTFSDSSLPASMVTSNLIYGFGTDNFVNYNNNDFHLKVTSVAVNAGSNTNWQANSGNVTTDLSGSQRIFDFVIDLGAYELQLDTTPPVTPGFDVQNITTNNVTIFISGTKSSDTSVITLLCSTAITINATTYPTATSWQVKIEGLTEGTNTVTINAQDAAANASGVVTMSILLDITAPIVTLNNPVKNSYAKLSIYVEYSLSEVCSPGAVKLSFTRTGGSSDPNSPHTITSNLTYHAGINTFNILGNDLFGDGSTITSDSLIDGGIYNVSMSVSDLVGNTSIPTINTGVTYDISSPASASVLVAVAHPGSRVSLSWGASLSGDVETYKIFRGTNLLIITNNIGNTTNTGYEDYSVIPSQNNYYQVVVVDHAGNESPSSNKDSAGNITISKQYATSKGGLSSQPIPGTTVQYSITFTNNGYGPVKGIGITDMLPATTNTVYVVGSAAASASCLRTYQHAALGAYDTSETAPIVGIKWSNFAVLNAGEQRTATYAVIIK